MTRSTAQRLLTEVGHGLLLERTVLIRRVDAGQFRLPGCPPIGEKADHSSVLPIAIEEKETLRVDVPAGRVRVPCAHFDVKGIPRATPRDDTPGRPHECGPTNRHAPRRSSSRP